MTKVLVSMQSKERWGGDIVVCNGDLIGASNPLRFRLHEDIKWVSDRGRILYDRSSITIMRHGAKVFGKVLTEAKDESGRKVPILLLILNPGSRPSVWASDLADGLEFVSKESGYELSSHLIARVGTAVSSTARGGSLLTAIVDALVELVKRLFHTRK